MFCQQACTQYFMSGTRLLIHQGVDVGGVSLFHKILSFYGNAAVGCILYAVKESSRLLI